MMLLKNASLLRSRRTGKRPPPRTKNNHNKVMGALITFMGCGVGELRLEKLKSSYAESSEAVLVQRGLLQIVPAKDKKYVGLALTQLGKDQVAAWESYYAYI